MPLIRNMLNEDDRLRARFAANDRVEFPYSHYLLKGNIAHLNAKRAAVLVDGETFSVPYEQLRPDENTARKRVEKIERVLKKGLDLMAEHGLKNWSFKFDHSTRIAGKCSFQNRVISIAFDLARHGNEADIRDTILHEIAHALVGKGHNHDAVWKQKSLEIGCSGKRTHSLQFSPPRWNVTCENRCWTHTAQQRNSKLICRICGSRLVYTPA